MNCFVAFRAVLPALRSATLRITASTLYRAFVGDTFIGCGPARAAHGCFRVDEWLIECGADCELRIEVAGYNANSYYVLDQPSFLQAEVVANDGAVVVATGEPGVIAFALGFGHFAYGSVDFVINGERIPGDQRRGRGIHANAAMRVDPYLGNTPLVDPVGGSAVFYDTMVKVVRA